MRVSLEMPKEEKAMVGDLEAMLTLVTVVLHGEVQSSTLLAQSQTPMAQVSILFHHRTRSLIIEVRHSRIRWCLGHWGGLRRRCKEEACPRLPNCRW